MAKENGTSEMISFEGQKDKNELLPYYQSADIFIFPSKKEGMPNAVLEAMACALPVVMSPCQGSKELIGGNGIIADSDLNRFPESLRKLISESTENLSNLSANSRQRAIDHFSWKYVADSYIDVFNRLI